MQVGIWCIAHLSLYTQSCQGMLQGGLKYNIVPFIIEVNLKMFYYRGLKEWNNEKGYLIDTCLTAQDKYKAYLDYFRIEY